MSTLFVYSPDGAVSDNLVAQATAFNASDTNDCGFDLNLYAEPEPGSGGFASEVLMTTKVHAKMCTSDDRFTAFDLRLRSSVPREYGWMLGNSVGTIDASYCGELKAYMVNFRAADNVLWRSFVAMHCKRIVQVVAPDMQKFSVCVLNTKDSWDRIVSRCKDRNGGFGSTGV